jgi:protein-tyrosine phosphatase
MFLFTPKPELRILVVCTANVCRSPMAEAMLRARLKARGWWGRVDVRSAGTRVAQPGRKPDPRVLRLLREKGVPAPRMRARQLTPQMLQEVDWVLVMVSAHAADVRAMIGGGEPSFRLRRLGSYRRGVALGGEVENSAVDIPDPYFGSWVDILRAFDHIDSSLDGVMRAVELGLRQWGAGRY